MTARDEDECAISTALKRARAVSMKYINKHVHALYAGNSQYSTRRGREPHDKDMVEISAHINCYWDGRLKFLVYSMSK